MSKITDILQGTKKIGPEIFTICKISLLTDDYFNVDAIYIIRKRLLECKCFKGKFSSIEEVPKDFFGILFSDYEIIHYIIDVLMNPYKQIHEEDDMRTNLLDFCLLIVYGKIILNACMYLFQYKEIISDKNLNKDDDSHIDNNKTRMTIELSRIYNGLYYCLYQLCYSGLSAQETISLIMIKFCDEVCMREESSIQYNRIARCAQLQSQLYPIKEYVMLKK